MTVQATKATVDKEVITIVKEEQVTLVLDLFTAQVLMRTVGNIKGGGKYRDTATAIFSVLSKTGVSYSEIPELNQSVYFYGEY